MSIAQMWHDEGRAEGRREGRQEGLKEGRDKGQHEARVAMLRRLLVLKFGARSLHRRYNALLEAATPRVIDRYLRRALKADSIATVFED
jgi:flagellar biosynthesis/type III secretory pathway protein FliH